jgi:hypothetical protein
MNCEQATWESQLKERDDELTQVSLQRAAAEAEWQVANDKWQEEAGRNKELAVQVSVHH